jgi:hypothetical protein
MMNKRGVSQVVTTVLIILFGIVAVAIIGAVVINQVNKGADRLEANSICNSLEFNLIRCYDEPFASTILLFKRGAGGIDLKIEKISAVFEKDDGTTEISNSGNNIIPYSIGETSVRNVNLDIANGKYKTAGIIVEVVRENGEKVTCDLNGMGQKVNCL